MTLPNINLIVLFSDKYLAAHLQATSSHLSSPLAAVTPQVAPPPWP